MEQTLIIIKHDALQRGLAGKILSRFEDTGLKIAAMKMVWADDKKTKEHYPLDEAWALQIYQKTKKVYDEKGGKMPYKDHIDIGKTIQSWLSSFLTEGPVIVLVLEGPHAVELARKLVGATEPRQAQPGTIRGDFISVESYALADDKKRVLRNLVHASDTPENAQREIAVWFDKRELHSYKKELDKHF